MPTSIRYRQALLDILRAQGREEREKQILNASRIASLENYLKKHTGVLQAFERNSLLAKKLQEEERLEEFLRGQPQMEQAYKKNRDEFRQVLAAEKATRERDTLLSWLYTASSMLSQADLLFRLSLERAKKNDAERDEGYQERDWPNRRSAVQRQQRVIEPESDRAGLRWFLLEATRLPAGQRLEAVDLALAATGRDGPEAQVDAFLADLYGRTSLPDLETRLLVFQESTKQLQKRQDAMLEFAAALRPLGEEIEARERARSGAMQRLRPPWVGVMRAMQRGRLAPDANGTLRVGFGVVRGYEARDGVTYRPQTTIQGILEKDRGERPFDSPPALLERGRAQDFGPYADPDLGTLPVGFVSTVNVTNGSSGSSALNAWGEIAGLAFDMNWEGIAADWVVDESIVRTVNVDSRYMLWLMDAIDGAHNLLQEMGLPIHFPR